MFGKQRSVNHSRFACDWLWWLLICEHITLIGSTKALTTQAIVLQYCRVDICQGFWVLVYFLLLSLSHLGDLFHLSLISPHSCVFSPCSPLSVARSSVFVAYQYFLNLFLILFRFSLFSLVFVVHLCCSFFLFATACFLSFAAQLFLWTVISFILSKLASVLSTYLLGVLHLGSVPCFPAVPHTHNCHIIIVI